MRKTKSAILEAVHATAQGLHRPSWRHGSSGLQLEFGAFLARLG